MKPIEPYFAVIFSSKHSGDNKAAYEEVAHRMLALAKEQPGFLGIESARGDDGTGITVSYWGSAESIQNWKANVEHMAAQKEGKEKWYSSFTVRICKVEREYSR